VIDERLSVVPAVLAFLDWPRPIVEILQVRCWWYWRERGEGPSWRRR
jgi:hypothetical protein